MQDKNPWRKHGPQEMVRNPHTDLPGTLARPFLPPSPTGLHWSECPPYTHTNTHTNKRLYLYLLLLNAVLSKWNATSWAKKIAAKKKRASSNDFTRFKVARAKSARNKQARAKAGL